MCCFIMTESEITVGKFKFLYVQSTHGCLVASFFGYYEFFFSINQVIAV